MGLMRRRRPLMRVAAGAATAGVAYHAGQKHAESEAAPAEAPPEAAAPAPAAAPASDDSVADLDHLVAMHESGALDDEEFSAAKAKLLGL